MIVAIRVCLTNMYGFVGGRLSHDTRGGPEQHGRADEVGMHVFGRVDNQFSVRFAVSGARRVTGRRDISNRAKSTLFVLRRHVA
jgi:hypothetical protein